MNLKATQRVLLDDVKFKKKRKKYRQTHKMDYMLFANAIKNIFSLKLI